MKVTEGKASGRDRLICLAMAVALPVGAGAVFYALPVLLAPVLWSGLALGAGLVVRDLALSVVGRFARVGPPSEPVRQPSFAFIIPCLNELPSLRFTVPAMRALRCEGDLHLCYTVEQAGDDGSLEYLRACAEQDARVVVIEKETPPGGRGAAVSHGLAYAPPCDVIGFVDADHVMGQDSLDELSRLFGQERPPDGIQGRCETLNNPPNWLARLLTIEREWLELVELKAAPRLGGMSQFGGGQGFFRRSLLQDERFQIDDSMVLDDTDLSCRLTVHGRRIEFDPRVSTRSLQPESIGAFLDQRLRWARGWVQLAGKYLTAPLRGGRGALWRRLDVLRLVVTPFGAAWLWIAVVAAAVALASGLGPELPRAVPRIVLLWPLALAAGPALAGARLARLRDAPLAAVGIPALTYCYLWLAAVAVVDVWVLRRPVGYAKVRKEAPGGDGADSQ